MTLPGFCSIFFSVTSSLLTSAVITSYSIHYTKLYDYLLAGESLGAMTQDQDEQVDSIGLYVQNEYSISQRVELTLGGRYDRLDFDVEDHFLSDGDDSGDRRFTKFSPRITSYNVCYTKLLRAHLLPISPVVTTNNPCGFSN